MADAAPEFAALARRVVADIARTAEPAVRPLIAGTRWRLRLAPTRRDWAAISPPGRPGELLLGHYAEPPPTITLFEETIRAHALARRVALDDMVRRVAIHELSEHRFGLNHTRERAAAAAMAVPSPRR